MQIRRYLSVATMTVGVVGLAAAPAQAAHDHFLVTPNGQCHQIAQGQTGIAESDHGGYHRYHHNVHLGATESTVNPDALGDGQSRVSVYKTPVPSPFIC